MLAGERVSSLAAVRIPDGCRLKSSLRLTLRGYQMESFSAKSLLPLPPTRRLMFHSELSVEECSKRLTKGIGDYGSPKGEAGIVGTLVQDHLTLRTTRPTRSFWRVRLEGDLIADDKGTLLEGAYSIFSLTELYTSCTLVIEAVLTILILIVFVAQVIQAWQTPAYPPPFCNTGPLFFIGLAFLLATRARQLDGRARRKLDEEAMTAFLGETLQALPLSMTEKKQPARRFDRVGTGKRRRRR